MANVTARQRDIHGGLPAAKVMTATPTAAIATASWTTELNRSPITTTPRATLISGLM